MLEIEDSRRNAQKKHLQKEIFEYEVEKKKKMVEDSKMKENSSYNKDK
jgi:hypothetical protein